MPLTGMQRRREQQLATMDTRVEQDGRLVVRLDGRLTELPDLRSALSSWLSHIGILDPSRKDLVLVSHEIAAEAIERGAAEVAVLGEVVGDAVRVSVAGGDWSSLDDLRSKLIRGLIGEIRVHRGIVTMRLHLNDVSGAPADASRELGRRVRSRG
jgi:hypothetical protein